MVCSLFFVSYDYVMGGLASSFVFRLYNLFPLNNDILGTK